ncbi:DUF2235 domain-containing protein, partial [uncultured Paraglaciecola sp.]|uniref:T6SS phospholipase effector Tle1-like catalytic domain-containing protein n=1 Tax=uncultured Paraglaciecola sp. TaxID=1765024 RepID=UPI002635E5AE
MEIALGIMIVIIAGLIFALNKANEIRKTDAETLLALNYVEFECLQILVANGGVANKGKFKPYQYKTLNDLAETYDVLIDSDGNVTNVVHLKRILKNDPDNQIVTYHRGIGNDNENSRIKKVLKGATGADIDDIITNAYAKFVQNWHKGDLVYIFGFSRGAATARLLAAKINREGIPHELKIHFKSSVNKETKVVEQRVEKYEVTSKKSPFKVDVEFLGVWDTVAALGAWTNFMKFLGINKKNIFQDFHIATNIKKAVHLVAIDETRSIFSAALMNHKE